MIRKLSVAEELALREEEWKKLKRGSLCRYLPDTGGSAMFIVETMNHRTLDAIVLDSANINLLLFGGHPVSSELSFDELRGLQVQN